MRKEALKRSGSQVDSRMPANVDFAGATTTHSSGSPLPDAMRAHVEPLFNHSFAGVRVHDDQHADVLAQSVGAEAFAQGNDLFFRDGSYDPDSTDGAETIAHELAHVVQQSRFGVANSKLVSERSDASETEARSASHDVAMGIAPSITSAPSAAISREEHEEGGGWLDALKAVGGLAAPFLPYGEALSGPMHFQEGMHEAAEGKGSGILGTASLINSTISTAAELGGFELLGAEGAGAMGLGELGGAAAAGELGTLGLAGPVAAVAGAGLGGAAFGDYLSKNTEVGENSVGAIGAIDRLFGGDPEHGQSAVVAMDDYRQSEWDRGGTGYLTGTGALLGEAAVGTAGAVAGLGEGIYHGLGSLWDKL